MTSIIHFGFRTLIIWSFVISRISHELFIHLLDILAILTQRLILLRILTFSFWTVRDFIQWNAIVRLIASCVWNLEPRETFRFSVIPGLWICNISRKQWSISILLLAGNFCVKLIPQIHILLNLCAPILGRTMWKPPNELTHELTPNTHATRSQNTSLTR